MTAARTARLDATISFEFACDRHCGVEIDLTDARIGSTLGKLELRAEQAHRMAHGDPATVYRLGDDVVVRAAAPAGAR